MNSFDFCIILCNGTLSCNKSYHSLVLVTFNSYMLHKVIYYSLFNFKSLLILFFFHFAVLCYDIPKNEAECKKKIREEFKRHAHVTDVRIIDRLIIRVS